MAVEQGSSTTNKTIWELDASHTLIELATRHLMFTTVKGRLKGVRGTIELDEANPGNSSVTAEIDASTVDTGDERRDGHLKAPDFLDVAKWPTITFKSTSVESTGHRSAKVTGDLTIRDVTKPITLDVKLHGVGKSPWGSEVASFEARTRIARKDWGMVWNVPLEGGGFLVGDHFDVEVHAEAIKKA